MPIDWTIVSSLLQVGIEAVRAIRDFSSPSGDGTPILEAEDVLEATTHHLRYVKGWSESFGLRDISSPGRLREAFVDLDLNLQARRTGAREPDRTYRVSQLLSLPDHIVMIGDPGAGKTTSLKRLAQSLLFRFEEAETDPPAPFFLLQFRELKETDSLYEKLLSLSGLSINLAAVSASRHQDIRERALVAYLDSVGATILLDGLDEAPPSILHESVQQIRRLLLGARRARFILTCRSGAFLYRLDNALQLELSPLTEEQVASFAQVWLPAEQVASFLTEIGRSPYDGAEIRPLTLVHLCAIYRTTGSIPAQPRTVYRTIVRLYLREWDEQRSVRRQSRYARFEPDRKEEFLASLAWSLICMGARGSFAHAQLQQAYRAICRDFGLPVEEAEEVAREIEAHTGLIVEAGYTSYEFAHLSIQEYLAAQYLIRLPRLEVEEDVLLSAPDELAVAVGLSSRPSEYAAEVICEVLKAIVHVRTASGDEIANRNLTAFVGPFLSRVLLERPDFSESLALGAAILTLANAHPEDRADGGAFSSLMQDVTGAIPMVGASVRAFIEFCRVSLEGATATLEPDYPLMDIRNQIGAYRFLAELNYPEELHVHRSFLGSDHT